MRRFVPLPLVLVALACAPKPGGGPAMDSTASSGAPAAAAVADSTAAVPAGSPAVPLEGTAWRLVELDGKPLPATADSGRAPGLTLLVDGHKVQGSAGCNRMTGSYQLGGTSLVFGPLATTRMACPAMETEQAYLKALGATTRYEIAGSRLTLFGPDGALARLEAPAPG